MGTLGSNGLTMMTLIYTKQIIHVSGPLDVTSFFVCDKVTSFFVRELVLRQKGDLATCYPQIICYPRLLLKYTNMYLLTDKISAMNLMRQIKSIPGIPGIPGLGRRGVRSHSHAPARTR